MGLAKPGGHGTNREAKPLIVIALVAALHVVLPGVAPAEPIAPQPAVATAESPAKQGQSREVQRSFTARDGMTVELENLAGQVIIEGASGGEIEVVGTVHAESTGLLDELEVTFTTEGDRVIARAEYPVDRYDTYYYPDGNARANTRYGEERVRVTSRDEADAVLLYVDFRLRLPPGVGASIANNVGNVTAIGVQGDLSVDTGSGDVSVTGGAGSVNADTGSGDVVVRDQQGDVAADTGSGDVEVESVVGDLDADTGSGDIDARDIEAASIRADTGSGSVRLERISGSVEADTGSGSIELADLLAGARVIADTGSGGIRISGDLSGADRIRVESGSGSVEIELTEVSPMTLRLSTGSGGIEVDLPDLRIVSSRRNSFRGEVRGGGAEVVVSTGSGGISLRSR